MPTWLIGAMMAVVFTAVLATGQGLYWAWVAKKDREQEELLRRLGSGGGSEEDNAMLFREQAADSVAQAMGGIGENLQTRLRLADVNYGVSSLIIRMLIAGGVTGVIGGIFVGWPGMALGLVAAYLPLYLVTSQGEARKRRLVEQLPDSLELMSRSLSAGLGLNDAFRLVAEEMPMPIAGEFGRLQEEVRFGRDYREAFDKMLARNPGMFDLRIVVSSIMLQRDTGGNLIEILENISDTIRSRFMFDAKVKAMTSEAKFSAIILGGLPFVVLMILYFMNPSYLDPLFDTTIGNAVLFADILGYGTGVMIMNDMTKVDV